MLEPGAEGLRAEGLRKPIIVQILTPANELQILNKAASKNEGVQVSVQAKAGEDFYPEDKTHLHSILATGFKFERIYEKPDKVPDKVPVGQLYVKIKSPVDLDRFWGDVENLRQELANPKK